LLCSTVTGELILIGWLGTSGRPATAREQAEARAPYSSAKPTRRERRREIPDELLADEEAVELARREQEREPADLISRAA
jgi:hypothetical protein